MGWQKHLVVGLVGGAVALDVGSAQSVPISKFERGEAFASYQAFKDELAAIGNTADAAARAKRLDKFWDALRTAGQMPYAQGERYAMLYRGPAKSVAFPGDQSGWNPSKAVATRLAGTDL